MAPSTTLPLRSLFSAFLIFLAFAVPVLADSTSADSNGRSQFVMDSIHAERNYELRELELLHGGGRTSTEIIGVLIPVICILGAFLVVWRSSEAKKEVRLAMIERGLDPSTLDQPTDESSKKYGALRLGMLLAGLGLGLLLALFVVSNWPQTEYTLAVFVGFAILMGGAGLTGYHIIARRLER